MCYFTNEYIRIRLISLTRESDMCLIPPTRESDICYFTLAGVSFCKIPTDLCVDSSKVPPAYESKTE